MPFSTRTNHRNLGRTRHASLLAVAAVLAVLASLLALTATVTANAAPLAPAAVAARGRAAAAPPGGLLLSHVCRVLGSDETTQAVHCADLLSLGRGSAVGQNEVYCQNLASLAIVQCKGVVQSVELAVPEGRPRPVFTRPERGICSAAFEAAACGARRVVSRTAPTPAGRAGCQAWTGPGPGPDHGTAGLASRAPRRAGPARTGPAIRA